MTAKQKKQQKDLLDKLHTKYYGKKKSNIQKPKTETKTPDEIRSTGTPAKEPTRHELMLQAKAKGIKNFRVINKRELIEILKEGTTQDRINDILAQAIARWKAGWGKKKQKAKEN